MNILLFLNNAFDSPLILKLILFYKFISSKSFNDFRSIIIVIFYVPSMLFYFLSISISFLFFYLLIQLLCQLISSSLQISFGASILLFN
jgi:hypothetical protein